MTEEAKVRPSPLKVIYDSYINIWGRTRLSVIVALVSPIGSSLVLRSEADQIHV